MSNSSPNRSTKTLAVGAIATALAGIAHQYFPVPATMIPFPEYVGPIVWAVTFTLGFGALVRAWPWADQFRHSHGRHPLVLAIVGVVGAASFILAWLVWGPKQGTSASQTPQSPTVTAGPPKTAPFFVEARNVFFSQDCKPTPFFVMRRTGELAYVEYAGIVLFIDIVNNESVPRTVRTLSVEVQTVAGWHKLRRIDTSYGTVMWDGDNGTAMVVGGMEFLDRLLLSPVQPLGHVQGNLMLAPTGRIIFAAKKPELFRFTISDVTGVSQTLVVSPALEVPDDIREGAKIQNMGVIPFNRRDPKVSINWPTECLSPLLRRK
jgi:hypothetical protein